MSSAPSLGPFVVNSCGEGPTMVTSRQADPANTALRLGRVDAAVTHDGLGLPLVRDGGTHSEFR
jgi:hypothetical protein